MADKLDSGVLFPPLTLNIAGGEQLVLPDAIDTPLALVLFYRGHW
jgi:hypothetical protein